MAAYSVKSSLETVWNETAEIENSCTDRAGLTVHHTPFAYTWFSAKIYVQEYDERDLDPPHIGPTDYFVRTTLKVRQKQFKVSGCHHDFMNEH